ncbi:ABC transporter ATP-binding protein [Oscillatoria salina]|uniref:ABC transporter ATP-binding protein n=1 Tax=Oscillatoria salina TaxID=331517 RepID=UPI001CCF7DB9|nr:polysaccharide ABC transporter ATP-binding protein [Oscillatoria salina]
MSDTVIRVENLGKKYIIAHQQQKRTKLLREALTNGAKSLKSKLMAPLGNKVSTPSKEEFWALADVCFEVKQGDVIGIIGRNGAGKSTLLKILSRITEPTTGRIYLQGRVASLLEVGTGFHPELTGRENIFLNGAILGMSKAEIKKKFDEIVAFAEVEKFLDTPVKRYSSGMYVRLAFAVAAHLEPEILIVDEVLAVGDAQFQKKCLGKMGDVATKEGRTVLFVSHSMPSVQRLCSRALLLEQGKLVLAGEVSSAVERYLNNTDIATKHQFNLLNHPRPKGNQANILFSKCLIIDSRREINSSLRLGEPFAVHLEAISRNYYEDLSLVVGVDTADERRISTVISNDFGTVFTVAPNIPLRVNVWFEELILYPGNYSVSIAIRSGRRSLDTLMYITRFQVSLLTYENTPPHNHSGGMVKTKARWEKTSQEHSFLELLGSQQQ